MIGKRQRIIGKRREHELYKTAVMVLLFEVVVGIMLYIYRIGVLRKKMHRFLRRCAKEEEQREPQRTDDMDYPGEQMSIILAQQR